MQRFPANKLRAARRYCFRSTDLEDSVVVCKNVIDDPLQARKPHYLLICWLALLPLLVLVFLPALSGPFLLDDSSAIEGNSDIRRVTPRNIVNLFRSHGNVRAIDHHPVSGLSFMLDVQLGGVDPFTFHVGNLIYHWLAAGVVALLFLAVWRSRGLASDSNGTWIAASLMVLWAVHPFATMPVGYITCRQEILLVLLYMASLTCLLHDRYWACWLCAVGAFLSKEVAVTLPFALLMLDWARGHRGVLDTLRLRWRFYSVLAASWSVICFYHLTGGRSKEIFVHGLPLGTSAEYFKAQCVVIAGYFRKFFWPTKLEFYPYVRQVESWTDWVPYFCMLLVYAGFALYALRWSRWLARSDGVSTACAVAHFFGASDSLRTGHGVQDVLALRSAARALADPALEMSFRTNGCGSGSFAQ